MLGMRPVRDESLDRPALDRCHGFRYNVLNSWGRERGKRGTQGIWKGLEEREEGGWGRRAQLGILQSVIVMPHT